MYSDICQCIPISPVIRGFPTVFCGFVDLHIPRPRALISAFLLLFLLIPTSLSLYTDPPLQEVTSHNLALAPWLNDHYDPSIAINGTVHMVFRGTNINWVKISEEFDFPLIHASAKLLTIDPSVDNATNIENNPRLVFAWGARADTLKRDDWESDDCTEYQNASSVTRSALVTFTFRNTSETVSTTTNVVAIPDSVQEAMQGTTGRDRLNIKLDSTFDFLYTIDDQYATFESGCVQRLVNFTESLNIKDEMNWTVEGDNTLFFLRTPVLNEQWFRNNHFDSIAFSDSRIYKGRISANNDQEKEFHLYSFNITPGIYGLQKIESIPLDHQPGIGEHTVFNTPIPLALQNNTYGYLYEFNYTYDGIGKNSLLLETSSFSGKDHSFSQALLSRALSHSGNISELETDKENVRKSRGTSVSSLNQITIGFGIIGLLVLMLLLTKIVKK